MTNTFFVVVFVYKDGIMSITESDIKGLIIEVRTLAELMIELPRVASDLLELNHGLTGKEIDKARLNIIFKFEKDILPQSNTEHSVPEMTWNSKEQVTSPIYAGV